MGGPPTLTPGGARDNRVDGISDDDKVTELSPDDAATRTIGELHHSAQSTDTPVNGYDGTSPAAAILAVTGTVSTIGP